MVKRVSATVCVINSEQCCVKKNRKPKCKCTAYIAIAYTSSFLPRFYIVVKNVLLKMIINFIENVSEDLGNSKFFF